MQFGMPSTYVGKGILRDVSELVVGSSVISEVLLGPFLAAFLDFCHVNGYEFAAVVASIHFHIPLWLNKLKHNHRSSLG